MFGSQFGVVSFFYSYVYQLLFDSSIVDIVATDSFGVKGHYFLWLYNWSGRLIDLLDNCPINPFRGSVFYPDIFTLYVLVRYFNERFFPANPIRI